MICADKVMSEQQLNKLLKKLKLEAEKAKLIISTNPNKKHPKDQRIIMDCYLFSLISSTGLRISEALKLKTSDLHEDYLIIREEISKNNQRGTVYYGPRTRVQLDEFLSIRGTYLKGYVSDYLFSMSGAIASRSYMHTRFKYWLQAAQLPGHFSIHSLRHTYGTLCLDKGLSLTFVRDNLRHSNISVTSQYLHLTRENRDKIKDIF